MAKIIFRSAFFGAFFYLLWVLGVGCGSGVQCGPGTVRKGDLCVPAPGEGRAERSEMSEVCADDGGCPFESAERGGDGGEVGAEQSSDLDGDGGELSDGRKSRVGEKCRVESDCQSGLCLRDGYCTRKCKLDDDCPVGMKCREVSYRSGGGDWRTFAGCVHPGDKPRTCQRDADCRAYEVCTTALSPKGDAVVKVCAQAVQGGRLPGEECNASKGVMCRNRLCVSDSFCTALCKADSDCPDRWKCGNLEIVLPNGKKASVKACTPPVKKCQRDRDCPSGMSCQGFLSKDQSRLEFYCAPINRSGAKAGEPCAPGSTSEGCYNGMCVDFGFCLALCIDDADCRKGFKCRDVQGNLPKGKFNFKGCVPDPKPCQRDGDCAPGLICILAVDQKREKLEPYCGIPRLKTRKAGEACDPKSTDPAKQCGNYMCLSHGYCSAFCKADGDCPSGMICKTLTVELKPGKVVNFNGCVKKN